MRKIILIPCLFIPALLFSACSFNPFPSGAGNSGRSAGGVLKSVDNGVNWQEKNLLENSQTSLATQPVSKIAFDIFDKNVLYAATSRGFYISDNGADLWKPLVSNGPVTDFALNPKTRGIIYLASGAGVFKTTDTGANWQQIYTEVRPNVTIASLAVSYRDTSRVYLLTNDGSLVHSADWGGSWQALHTFGVNTRQLLLDPYDSRHMYVAADNGLYETSDGAKTWLEILAANENKFAGLKQYKSLFFTDVPDELIYLSRYGILKSSDRGASWQSFNLVTPAASVDISGLAFNPANKHELYYTASAVLYHTLDNGLNWTTTSLPLGQERASHLLVNGTTLYLGLN